MIRVLFVCMGNICRSPTAEGVFRQHVASGPLAGAVEVDSAGTHGYHVGEPPDPRTFEHAARRGYDLSALRARAVDASDFATFDYILAMDAANRSQLLARCPPLLQDRIALLMEIGGGADSTEVPDPYYGSPADFEHVLDLIEAGCTGLHALLLDRHRPDRSPS